MNKSLVFTSPISFLLVRGRQYNGQNKKYIPVHVHVHLYNDLQNKVKPALMTTSIKK